MKMPMPLLLTTVFLNIGGFSLILPLLPFYGQAFEASPFGVACLFAAYSFGNIFGEIFWGRQSDSIGRRPVLIITTACAALSYVAFAFAPTLAAAILIRIVSGFFSGTLSVVQGMIADTTPPQERAKNMGYFGAAFNLGFAVGPALGGLLADSNQGLSGFHTPIFAAAIFVGLASLWSLLALPESNPNHGQKRSLPRYSEALRYVASNGMLARLFIIAFCGIAAFASMEAVFGLWAERNFRWGAHEVGLTFLAIGGTGLFVQVFLIGPLVSRFGEPKIIITGLLLLALVMLLMPMLRLPIASVVLMGGLMAGHSLTFPNAGALVSRTTPPDRQGSVMGFNMASNAASRIIAPPIFGWVYSLNIDAPFYVCALMIAATVPVAIGVLKFQRQADQRQEAHA